MRHLLATASLTGDDVVDLLARTDALLPGGALPEVRALRGRTVATLFPEGSDRTRLSFEVAARRLGADTVALDVDPAPGGSLREVARTVEATGADAVVVRHGSAGVPHRLASWVDAAVVNAGDGAHDHPTRALLDAHVLTRRLGTDRLDGVRVAVVGASARSRVARADVTVLAALGASITLVAPPTLLPPSLAGWPVTATHDLDAALGAVDVVSVLGPPREPVVGRLVPSWAEWVARYGLTAERLRRLGEDVVVLHPGPVRGTAGIAPEAAADPRVLVADPVHEGVAVRMAVLLRLLAPDAPVPAGPALDAAAVADPGADPTALEPSARG